MLPISPSGATDTYFFKLDLLARELHDVILRSGYGFELNEPEVERVERVAEKSQL